MKVVLKISIRGVGEPGDVFEADIGEALHLIATGKADPLPDIETMENPLPMIAEKRPGPKPKRK